MILRKYSQKKTERPQKQNGNVQLTRTESPSNKKSQNKKNKSIWEEGEDSIVSLLFGKGAGPKGLRSRFEKIFDQDVGTNALTKFLGTLSKGALLVVNYLCRWASVKGTIPQPVIVMAVISVAISTKRRKVNSVFVTVLVLRTVGELLHELVTKMKKKHDETQEKTSADDEITSFDTSTPAKEDNFGKECWDGDGL